MEEFKGFMENIMYNSMPTNFNIKMEWKYLEKHKL